VSSHSSGVAFRRRRIVSGVTSLGVLAGLGLVAAAPVSAATAADCTPANTVAPTSLPDAATALQALLDAATAVICIDGVLVLTAELVASGPVSFLGLSGAVLDGAETHRILDAPGESVNVEGIRFTGGRGDEGGAIRGGAVTIVDSVFDHNVSAGQGGAVDADAVEVTGSVFEDNSSGGWGGGAIWFDSTATIASSEFRRNSTEERGGAIASYGVVTSLSDSTFEDNTVVYYGGAVYAQTAATITNSTFARNASTFQFGTAGAVFTGTATITNSTFVGNSSINWAGAIYSSRATIAQSTFLDNTADWGNSVVARGGTDSTYAGSIFAGTALGLQLADYDGEAAGDLGGNVFTNAQADELTLVPLGAGTIFGQTVAAIFGTEVLGDNGGDVPTLALPEGSVAIDLVPPGSPVTTDQRGWTRVAANDAGAFEFGAVDPTLQPAAEEPTLPPTGAEPGILATFAAALLAAGALALGLVRRRRA
jgi:hypothetical protein